MDLAPYVLKLAMDGLPTVVKNIQDIPGVKFEGWDERATPGACCAQGYLTIGTLPTIDLGDMTIDEVARVHSLDWYVRLGDEMTGRVVMSIRAVSGFLRLNSDQVSELARLSPVLSDRTIELGPLKRLPELDDAQRAALAAIGTRERTFGKLILEKDYNTLRSIFANFL